MVRASKRKMAQSSFLYRTVGTGSAGGAIVLPDFRKYIEAKLVLINGLFYSATDELFSLVIAGV